MTELTSQLFDATQLLALGMVFVFVFLAMLILVIQLLAKIAPSAPAVAGGSNPSAATRRAHADPNKLNPSVVAAISAAVTQYRKQA